MGKANFNLAELLGDAVPNLDTASVRDQIDYIDIELLDDDPKNFYELSGVEELASNIELFGLQQPLRVRPNPEAEGRYIIVSGHRRRAATRLLVDEGKDKFRLIACIKERPEGSDALQELRLIYANSDTRRMTPAEISRQAERVEALLYQLKEEGYEFPGRMRDHVAAACQVSKSKLARLKVIRENLTHYFSKLFNENAIGESLAYEIAKMPHGHQAFIEVHQDILSSSIRCWALSTATTYERRLSEIDKVVCKGGGECTNCKNKYMASLKRQTWDSDTICAKCCSKCEKLVSCKYACPGLAGKVKKLKADAKARREQEEKAQEERDRPQVEEIQKYWDRFGRARAMAGKGIPECMKALGLSPHHHGDADKVMAKECLEHRFTASSDTPYGWVVHRADIKRLVALADELGCSIDYLFGRTENMSCNVVSASAPTSGAAWYPMDVPPDIGQRIIVMANDGFAEDAVYEGAETLNENCINKWDDLVCWTPAPKGPTAEAHAEPPAEDWLPLQWIPGMENPTKDRQKAFCKFACEGMAKPLERVAIYDMTMNTWSFPAGGTIDAECVAWFPLPAE